MRLDAHGDRPRFKLVTGISTGVLIAPFAFLGSPIPGFAFPGRKNYFAGARGKGLR